jgi:50S ribosomal protein L16 3-hydroxylase
MQIRDFDIDGFLHDYWQQKPLLIRNPWTEWSNPLAPDELAGLACEEGVEARLIAQPSAGARDGWMVEHGPLPETRFGTLGKQPWTLLVQAVDHLVPEVAALIAPFRFIPNWRIDDVMVSYAVDGGGVGPHFDHYDVFLLQGLGKRRWQVGGLCDSTTPLLPHDDLRLLADFQATDEYILEPGDILYLPPGFAHDGVAIGDDCMTYSIGFRAPSHSELIAHYSDDVLGRLEDENRYSDPQLVRQDNPGEITAEAIARLHAMVTEKLLDQGAFTRWFGQYSSTRKYPDIDWQPQQPIAIETLRECLATEVPMLRNPASRFSFARQRADSILLFVDGQCFDCTGDTAELAEILCAEDRMAVPQELRDSQAAMNLLAALFNQGSIAFEPED